MQYTIKSINYVSCIKYKIYDIDKRDIFLDQLDSFKEAKKIIKELKLNNVKIVEYTEIYSY